MELENIIITSKPEYNENYTLNFLLIFVCYVHDFVPSMVRLSNGIVCILNRIEEKRLLYIFVKIIFLILLMGTNIH